MLKSLLTEYGFPWVINRTLYALKLKTLKKIPITEKLYEKSVDIKRIDLFDLNIEAIEKFLKSIPKSKQDEIIAIADNAIKGKIIAFSSIELNYGQPLNWHYHPITNMHVDKKLKWFQIPDFDSKRGDIKVIWEPSRLTHFYYFVRAYLLTKDKKYYNAFSEQLESWIKENKYSYGPNYKCGQEATIRMINALITYSAFKECNLITEKDQENLIKIIEGSYKKVLSNFFYAHKCIKNNHTLSEITGLIIGAWCIQNNRQLENSYELLNKEINTQFSTDGGYIQNSFNYQRLALQLIEFIIKISNKTNFHITDSNKQKILNSAYQLYQLQDKSGDVPNRGPNDGALIFPVTSCDYRDFRPIINSISNLISGVRLYKSGLYDEEILWFSNNELNSIPINQIKRKSSCFYKSGLFSLRKSSDTFLMIVLKNNKTRPNHMDQLHIDLWHKGSNIFCDTGSYSYADPIGIKLSLTESHNTVKVNNIDQMNKKGAFFVTDWSTSKKVEWSKNKFTGTMISKNGYKHKRTIKIIDKGYLVKDEVKGKGDYCEFNFHTPYNVVVKTDRIQIYVNENLACELISDGSIEIKKTYRSLYYYRKEKINCISIRKHKKNKKCTNEIYIKLY